MMHRLLTIGLLMSALTVHAAPDEERLGKSKGYPVGTDLSYFYDETVRVGSFSALDKINFRRATLTSLKASDKVMPLPTSPDATSFAEKLRWRIGNQRTGQTLTLDDYLARQRIMALLIVKDGQILFERYQYDRQPEMRFLSNSMAKSMASLAFGYALQEGKIESLDARADELATGLKGTLYGEATLRQLLRMSSGAAFVEDYSGQDDAARFSTESAMRGLVAAAKTITKREAIDGERFKYTSSQTSVLSHVFQAATKQSMASYIERKLWQPMGAASNAGWLTDMWGETRASGNFIATAQDYARLGVVLANDGVRPDTGAQVMPRDYLLEATDWRKHPNAFAPRTATPYFGYGYQFWTYPSNGADTKRRFALLGVYGQRISVDPAQKLVMVQLAANATASAAKTTLGAESDALWRGVVAHFGTWD